jgi:hypothetical protein
MKQDYSNTEKLTFNFNTKNDFDTKDFDSLLNNWIIYNNIINNIRYTEPSYKSVSEVDETVSDTIDRLERNGSYDAANTLRRQYK